MRMFLIVLLQFVSIVTYSQVDEKRLREVDSLACVMSGYHHRGEYLDCNTVGNTILYNYSSELLHHPYFPSIIREIVAAKLSLKKWEDIPDIVDEWWPYVMEQTSPEDSDYYNLPLFKCLALFSLGKHDIAKQLYRRICNIYATSNIENIKFQEVLKGIGDTLELPFHTRKERKEWSHTLFSLGLSNLLGKDPETWKDYHKWVRNLLADYYYDTSNPADEAEWSENIVWQEACFIKGRSYMLESEGELYDNILVYKDFLNYHNSKNNKLRKSWRDIQSILDKDEVAIEISMYPSEFLIIKKDQHLPISIGIDSLLVDKMKVKMKDDPLLISELYQDGTPLQTLWNLLEPQLNGIKRIYISGSQLFTQINYSVIPFDGGLTGDKYDIIQLTTTADIESAKKYGTNIEYKTACVYGAIDYNNTIENPQSYAREDSPKWTIYRCIPTDLRSSFINLPGSSKEVEYIDSIMSSKSIPHTIVKGAFADEKSFKSIDGHEVGILHISTHGFMLGNLISNEYKEISKEDSVSFYQTKQYQSGLLLAGANNMWLEKNKNSDGNDGILTSKEISELDLRNVSLAVLSACETGLGETDNLTGISYGVQNAFKSAGVPMCLATLWKISDYATSEFYKLFYTNLFEYNDVYKSLRMTQNAFRESSEFSSPFYWAGFVILE